MFSEHLSSLPVDSFLKSCQQGIQWQLNMLLMDLSVWVSLPPPYRHCLSPLRPRVLAALPGGNLSVLPFLIALVDAFSPVCLSLSLVGCSRKARQMNNERYVAWGWSGVVIFIQGSSGSCSGKETCFPQVLMSMGQETLMLCKVWLSLMVKYSTVQ